MTNLSGYIREDTKIAADIDVRNKNSGIEGNEALTGPEAPKEKAILVGVDWEKGVFTAEKSLEELQSLAETAGCEAVCLVLQKRERPHTALYVGKGKLAEIKTLIDETGAEILIADDELSPSQIKNLYDELKIKIIDRTVLILDIFAARASSREGKIQVELAQQKYRLAHLSGIGVALSRLGGGIGTRGPGEKKLETDKRHIRRAITNLTEELSEIEKHRAMLRKAGEKKGYPSVSIVGYTNAGKSTLLNSLTDAGVLAEDKLFATLDTTTRRLKLPGGSFVQLSDTVGFIGKLPHQLIKAFRATLEELNHADVLLHIIDVSSPEFKEQMAVAEGVLAGLGAASKPIINVYNKTDLCEGTVFGNGVFISAKSGEGIEKLLMEIESVLKSTRKKARFLLPYNEGGLLSAVHGKCEIISESHEEDGVLLEAYVNEEVYGRLRKYTVD